MGKHRAVSGVSFDMNKGELLAVLGASGAGKSCLADVVACIVPVRSGRLEICGLDASCAGNMQEIRKKLAIMLQQGEDNFLSGYLDEELSYGPLSMGLSEEETALRVREALAFVGLSGFERRSPQLLTGIQRKRAALAAALSTGAELLVLDEPFSGLCRKESRQMQALIERLRKKGVSILLFTKEPEEAACADRVLLMADGGSAAFGCSREILSDDELLESVGLRPGFAVRVFLDLRAAGICLEKCPVSMDELVDEICR